jgi:hypothetical protein
MSMLEQIHSEQSEPAPEDTRIPANVREYASKYHVGTPLLAYHDSQQLQRMLITRFVLAIGMIMVTLLCLAAYITGVIQGQAGRISLGDQQDLLWLTVTFIGLTLLYIAGSWSRYQKYQQQLYICHDGLLRVEKDREEALRWDEVVDIFSANQALVAVYGEGLRRFAISEDLPHNIDLDQRIMRTVMKYLLPRMIEQFEAGVPLVFGSLLLNDVGLRYRGNVIPWEEIGNAREENGKLAFKARGEKWQHHALLEAPLVVELVKYVVRARLVKILATHAAQIREYEVYGNFSTERWIE